MAKRRKNARYYRRHPEKALREVTNLGAEQKRQFFQKLTDDPAALADLMGTTAPVAKRNTIPTEGERNE
jgi:hypothetical protein